MDKPDCQIKKEPEIYMGVDWLSLGLLAVFCWFLAGLFPCYPAIEVDHFPLMRGGGT